MKNADSCCRGREGDHTEQYNSPINFFQVPSSLPVMQQQFLLTLEVSDIPFFSCQNLRVCASFANVSSLQRYMHWGSGFSVPVKTVPTAASICPTPVGLVEKGGRDGTSERGE